MLRSSNKDRRKVGGYIGKYGLSNWWVDTFSEVERRQILETFQPMGQKAGSKSPIVHGDFWSSREDPAKFLSNLAGWFCKEENRTIGFRVIEKAEMIAIRESNTLTQHFVFDQKIKTYYRWRDVDKFALERAIEACHQQIELAPKAAKVFQSEHGEGFIPSHRGFKQLAIIEEKRGNHEEAILIVRQAANQGWGGDWDKRLARLEKQSAKKKR